MPKHSTRHWAKRKLISSRGNIETCGQHIYAVSCLYNEHHPEISEKLNCILSIISECDEMIDTVEKSI